MIPIYKPFLPKDSLRHAHSALNSTWISSKGRYVEMASESLKELLGVKYIQLVNSGTSATHLVSIALTHQHPNIQRLFVPNNVYVAAWNAFLYDKGIELIPIDADMQTWNIDTQALLRKIKNSPGPSAACIVHNLGNIINVPSLQRSAEGCVFVEDNCEGFPGKYEGKYSGTESLVSSISFFGNKTITSGEGGAVITNEEEVYELVRSSHGQGQSRAAPRYIHDKIGYNYRMTNVQAAILFGQLEVLPQILEKKQEIFAFYRKEFSSMEEIRIQKTDPDTIHSNWMMGVRVVGACAHQLAKTLSDEKIETRPMFYPMSRHRHLQAYANKGQETVANRLSKECLLLPSFPELTSGELKHVVDTIKRVLVK